MDDDVEAYAAMVADESMEETTPESSDVEEAPIKRGRGRRAASGRGHATSAKLQVKQWYRGLRFQP
jgi:hypothetical protein